VLSRFDARAHPEDVRLDEAISVGEQVGAGMVEVAVAADRDVVAQERHVRDPDREPADRHRGESEDEPSLRPSIGHRRRIH